MWRHTKKPTQAYEDSIFCFRFIIIDLDSIFNVVGDRGRMEHRSKTGR